MKKLRNGPFQSSLPKKDETLFVMKSCQFWEENVIVILEKWLTKNGRRIQSF